MKVGNSDWLALVIGNTRWHWGYFQGPVLVKTWDEVGGHTLSNPSQTQILLASVVPEQTLRWLNNPQVRILQLADIPLKAVYSSLGIDRALALWGAMQNYSYPCLVIDGGTGLTLTGANQEGALHGGAILPGLKLQLQSLAKGTAALPSVELTNNLPERWAKSTDAGIKSGIIYTVLAGLKEFISDWWQEFPESPVILTGGDGELIRDYLQLSTPAIGSKVQVDPYLSFWGMRSLALKT